MHRQLRTLAGLALATLLIAAPGLALAHGEGPQQTVDGYTVTLMPPEKGFFTGRNPIAVSLWDWQGNTPDATVSVGLLAFTPPGGGHGDSHGEAAPADAHAVEATDAHAATDSHDAAATSDHEVMADDQEAMASGHEAMAGDHDATTTSGHEAMAGDHEDTADGQTADSHEATADGHTADSHEAASATEGRGLALAPVALAPSEERGEYRGEIAFDEAGTYTVSAIFTVDGEEHGAIFDVAVAQSRPRGLVLGGFALLNALAIGTAGVIKWRKPAKSATKPARPAAATTTTTEE